MTTTTTPPVLIQRFYTYHGASEWALVAMGCAMALTTLIMAWALYLSTRARARR